jgi:hypothetical protein
MNAFPLAPFLASLDSDRIRVTLADYHRITTALRAGGSWNLGRLRGVLVALLAQNPDEETLIRQRFDSFFDCDLNADSSFTAADLESALAELMEASAEPQKDKSPSEITEAPPRYEPPVDVWTPRRKPRFSRRQKQFLLALISALVLLGACAYWTYPSWRGWLTPSEQGATGVGTTTRGTTTAQEQFSLTANADPPRQLPSEGSWWDYAGVGILTAALLLLAVLLYRLLAHREPDEGPAFDPEAPQHFRRGDIGGRPVPRLDDETLSQLADSLGFFRSELPGKRLDVVASVKTLIKTGLPSFVYHKRKSLRTVLVMEDAFAEPLAWTTVPQELAEGLAKRGVPVVYGMFRGIPSTFYVEGHTLWLDDLDNNRRDYLLLLFSDGKGISRRDELTLEALSRWPMAAWMELRERRFWDESTVRVARHGIPVYPATAGGLLQVTTRFLTERGTQKSGTDESSEWLGVPAFVGEGLAGHVEMLLGDALLWAQSCAMIQPVTRGLADALRRKFQPHLPPERLGRLMLLPGTTESVSGIRFSNAVLSVLRTGFAARWDEARQVEVLTFIMEKLLEVEPERADSLAHLAWECSFERVRLELEPERAARRLSQLDHSPLGGFIRAELENVVLPGAADGSVESPAAAIPLRVAPRDNRALLQLSDIADKIPAPPPFPRFKEAAKATWRRVKSYAAPYLAWMLSPLRDATNAADLVSRALTDPEYWRRGLRKRGLFASLGRALMDLTTVTSFLPLRLFGGSLLGPLWRLSQTGSALPPIALIRPSVINIYAVRDRVVRHWLSVHNLGGGRLTGKASSTQDWVKVYHSSFTAAADGHDVLVTVGTAGMLPGPHTGEVLFSTSVGELHIPVTVTVIALDWQGVRQRLMPRLGWGKRATARWSALAAALVAVAVAAIPPALPPNWLNRLFNAPPRLKAIQVEGQGQTVLLSAVVDDPNGDAVNYNWQTNVATVSGASGRGVLDLSGMDVASLPPTLDVRLTLTDSRGGNAVYDTTVNLKGNPSPATGGDENKGEVVTVTTEDKPPAEPATLEVSTNEDDVNIIVDGVRLGTVSRNRTKRLSLPPGAHTIEGTKSGPYKSTPSVVKLTAGQTSTTTIRMEAASDAQAVLVFDNERVPAWVKVIDARGKVVELFNAPAYSVAVAPGTYTLSFSGDGYVSYQESVTLAPNEKRVISVQLVRETEGRLRVPVLAGNSVLIDGKPVSSLDPSVKAKVVDRISGGKDPSYIMEITLPAGDHHVRIEAYKGFESGSTSVTIKPGEVTTIGIGDGLVGVLHVNGRGVADAKAVISNGATQSSQGLNVPDTLYLIPGTYTISIEKDGYLKYEKVVQVSGGEQTIDIVLSPTDTARASGFTPAKLLSKNTVMPPSTIVVPAPPKNRVMVAVTVDRRGNVTSAKAIDAVNADVGRAAENAAMKFNFQPATVGELPTFSTPTVEVIFLVGRRQ